jgi:CRISPR/Cas system CSM-associated protein Csm2 small subunit
MDDKESFAIRAIFNAMFAIGITARNAEEAEQAIDLAAKLLSYALGRDVSSAEIKERMLEMMIEAGKDETRH